MLYALERRHKIRMISFCEILSCLLVLLALCRSSKFNLSGNLPAYFGIFIVLLMMGNMLFLRKKAAVTWWDLLWVVSGVLSFVNRHPGTYSIHSYFYLISIGAMLVFRAFPRAFLACTKMILSFSILNLAVNVVNLVAPQAYFAIINGFLSNDLAREAQRWWNTEGFLCGLSDHYSRNAYFCVAGLMVTASYVIAGGKKRKKAASIISAVFLGFLLRIGKRGHLLFILCAILIVFLAAEPRFIKKVLRVLGILVAGIVVLAIAIRMIPALGFVFERMREQLESGDVSTGRFAVYAIALEQFMKEPWFGIGYGGFSALSEGFLGDFFAGVHNDYIQWLCELGIVGFTVNMVASIATLILTWRAFHLCVCKAKARGSHEQFLLTWSLMFQVFVLTYSMTGLPHFDYEINILYMISCAVPLAVLTPDTCYKLGFKRIRLKVR